MPGSAEGGPAVRAGNRGAALTDDCSAVERLGKAWSICIERSDEEHLKITTPVDLAIAEAILAEQGGTLNDRHCELDTDTTSTG